MNEIVALLPEIYLAVAAVIFLLYGAFRKKPANRMLALGGVFVLLGTLWIVICHWRLAATAMNGMFVTDGFTSAAKGLILLSAAMTVLISTGWLIGRAYEFIVLLFFAVLGMMLMVSANDMLALYLGLEMSSLALYVLAAFERDHAKSAEAGLKYFVLGGLASGMLLFGISLVYGFAGTTSFPMLFDLFADHPASRGVIVGLVLFLVAFCFKIAAVPFHMWAPDVYEGAPTPVTAFLATASKIAALSLLTRLLIIPFGPLAASWQQVLVLVSILSMFGGALAAIMQTNIKRLLAYSSISHAGFILVGLAVGTAAGVQAMLIYLALYLFMSTGMFGCVLLMRRQGEAVEEIRDLSGLAQTRPLMAAAIAVFMFSMAGIPPLAGFFGKFYVILAALNAGMTGLAVAAVIASVIGCFYYIKVVKVMYFDPATTSFDPGAPFMVKLGIAVGALVTAAFILVPMPLVALAQEAAKALMVR